MHSAADSAVTAGKSSLPDVSVETQIIILEKLCWGQIRFSVGSEEKISTERKRETEDMEEDMIYLRVASRVEKLWTGRSLGFIDIDLTERI